MFLKKATFSVGALYGVKILRTVAYSCIEVSFFQRHMLKKLDRSLGYIAFGKKHSIYMTVYVGA